MTNSTNSLLRLVRPSVAAVLIALLAAPLAPAQISPAQNDPAQSTQSPSDPQPAQPQQPAQQQPAQQPAAQQPAPDAPQPQLADPATRPANLQSDQQQNTNPVGTAAAPLAKPTGVAASRPAGAVIAPAKQRRVHSIFIRVGIIVAAGVAVGTAAALSRSSSSKP